jgi:hypothetical protein
VKSDRDIFKEMVAILHEVKKPVGVIMAPILAALLLIQLITRGTEGLPLLLVSLLGVAVFAVWIFYVVLKYLDTSEK